VGDFENAVRFLFTPDFSKIDTEVVLAAAGQAFFSVSVGLTALVEQYRGGIESLYAVLDDILPADARSRIEKTANTLVEDHQVPEPLAKRIASLRSLSMAPNIVLIAAQSGKPVDVVAKTFFAVSAHFETDRIVALAQALDIADYFDRLALNSTLENLAEAQRRLTAQVLATSDEGAVGLQKWAESRHTDLERTRRSLKEIAGDGNLTLSKLAVGASLLRDLVRA
jgi:glutamate dehydrogenase